MKKGFAVVSCVACMGILLTCMIGMWRTHCVLLRCQHLVRAEVETLTRDACIINWTSAMIALHEATQQKNESYDFFLPEQACSVNWRQVEDCMQVSITPDTQQPRVYTLEV